MPIITNKTNCIKTTKIFKRLVLILVATLITYLLVEFIRDPQSHIQAFKNGYNGVELETEKNN